MTISIRDQADLTWYFGDGMSEFFRSPSGAMLERQENLAFDSEGRRIPILPFVRIHMTYVSRGEEIHYTAPGYDNNAMMVRKESFEPSYTPSLESLSRFAKVSRKLRCMDEVSCRTMEAYYGDVGARWGRELVGRLFAIYPLTKTGRSMIAAVRAKFESSDEIRDDEVIATEADLQTRQPNDIRRKKLEKVRDEADDLLISAHQAWKVAA